MSIKGRWGRLWIDEFELSAKTSSATINMGMTREDVTAWQDTAPAYIVTGGESGIEISGYVDDLSEDAGGMEEVLADRLGAADGPQVGVLLAESAAAEIGMPVYVLPDAASDNMSISAPTAGILTINGTMGAGGGGMRRGLLLWRGEVTATGNKPSVDFARADAGAGDVFIWVTAISGTATNASIKVQSATTEAGTYADEATVAFSGVGGYSAAMAATISRWLRLNVVSMGGATGITLAVVACVDSVTQPE